MLDKFFEDNVQGQGLNEQYNWSSVSPALLDGIKYFNLTTVDVINSMFDYKYYSHEDINSIVVFLDKRLLFTDDISCVDEMDLDSTGAFLISKNQNGTSIDVLLPLGSNIARPAIELTYGKKVNMVYTYTSLFSKAMATKKGNYNFRYTPYMLFNRLVQYAIDDKATDLHIVTQSKDGQPMYPVYDRVGPLRYTVDLFTLDKKLHIDLVQHIVAKRSDNKAAESDLNSNRGVTVNVTNMFGTNITLRVSAKVVRGGYSCVIRIQKEDTINFKIPDLGFSPEIQKALYTVSDKRSGLTLFTGEIRTGKNTTMNAVANDIVSRPENWSIQAYDSPIEILGPFPQIDYKDNLETLKAAITHAKKDDLDFALLNEIPNKDVAQFVVDLVNSSVHVLTTWHMDRLWNLPMKMYELYGPEFRNYISQLNLVCNQKLYQQQCVDCLENVDVSRFGPGGLLEDSRLYEFFQQQGIRFIQMTRDDSEEVCETCGGTGVRKGKVTVVPEVAVMGKNLVRELLRSETPFAMEALLVDRFYNTEGSMEKSLAKLVERGELHYSSILTIL